MHVGYDQAKQGGRRQRQKNQPYENRQQDARERMECAPNKPFESLHWAGTRTRFVRRTCQTKQSHRRQETVRHPSQFGKLHGTGSHSRQEASLSKYNEKPCNEHQKRIPKASKRGCRHRCQCGESTSITRKVPRKTANMRREQRSSVPMPFRFGAIFSSSFNVKNSACFPKAQASSASQSNQRTTQWGEQRGANKSSRDARNRSADAPANQQTKNRPLETVLPQRHRMANDEKHQRTDSCSSSTILSRFSSSDRPFRLDMVLCVVGGSGRATNEGHVEEQDGAQECTQEAQRIHLGARRRFTRERHGAYEDEERTRCKQAKQAGCGCDGSRPRARETACIQDSPLALPMSVDQMGGDLNHARRLTLRVPSPTAL